MAVCMANGSESMTGPIQDGVRFEAKVRTHGMVFVRGGTFAMGSDKHYAEEAPVHRVTLDGFWIDETPVTNALFREFVEATGYITFAEIAPRAEDYPGALP